MIFETQEECLALVKGNEAAATFIQHIVDVLHFWDDLVDRDHVVPDEEINRAMMIALITLPRNPFYVQNFPVLNTILMNAITNWQVATRFERVGDDYEKRIAYILRSSYVDIITTSANIVGGPEWAILVGEKIRRFAHGETYDGYIVNLENECAERQRLGERNVL